MGEILAAVCGRCGFSTELYTGGGRMDCGRAAAALAVPEARLPDTEQMSVFRRPFRCSACGGLYARPLVRYSSHGGDGAVEGSCPRCGSGAGEELSETSPSDGACPVCGGSITLKRTGYWD